MASDKQLKANRANARRSTGPKTAAGKAVSRMNSCKHGLTAKTIVIGDEDPRELEGLRADLEKEFRPQPGIERELVNRLATLTWRIRRIPVCEASLIEARRSEIQQTEVPMTQWEKDEEIRRKALAEMARRYRPDDDATSPNLEVEAERKRSEEARVEARQRRQEQTEGVITGLALVLDSQKYQDALGKLSRYETTLSNAFSRTMQQLLFPPSPTGSQ